MGTLWFCLPLITHRILNIGNLTGIVIFMGILLYGLFQKKIHIYIGKLWEHYFGRCILSLLGICAAAVLILTISFSFLMFRAASAKPTADSTVIILGCRVYGTKPSRMLRERMDAALDYLKKHPKAPCILSGGKGTGENISEAECMFNYMTQKGIDTSRLILEDQSTSTRENLLFSKEILKQNDLNTNIALVTNEFHQYRAKEIAEKLNLHSGAVYGKTAWWLFPTFYVRELYGLIYEIIW